MNRFYKNRILAFVLVTAMLLPLCVFGCFSADAADKVFYVDAVSGLDKNDGKNQRYRV